MATASTHQDIRNLSPEEARVQLWRAVVGAAIFGHYGDRIGRKSTLIATLLTSLRAAPVLILAVLLVPASTGALWRCRYRLARALGVGQIVCLLVAWALAQWPYIIYPDVSLHATAAPPATLAFVLATLPLGMGLVLPSLWLLFAVFRDDPPREVVRHADRRGAHEPALAPEVGHS